jgi:hypothetical protein
MTGSLMGLFLRKMVIGEMVVGEKDYRGFSKKIERQQNA